MWLFFSSPCVDDEQRKDDEGDEDDEGDKDDEGDELKQKITMKVGKDFSDVKLNMRGNIFTFLFFVNGWSSQAILAVLRHHGLPK